MNERNILEEARNIARNAPVWPGDTISHATAAELERRGWARRNKDGWWVPTDTCPWTIVKAVGLPEGEIVSTAHGRVAEREQTNE